MVATGASGGEGPQRLGDLLVQHGVVTSEQLAAALERQRTTGRPLGEIVVELGFAAGPIVAQALATQHGGLVKTEYGFATGWANTGEAATPSVDPGAGELADRDRMIAELRDWATQAQAAIASRDQALVQRDGEIARLNAALAELRKELARREEELTLLRAGADARLPRGWTD
jgi:hypothetical protein